MPAEGLFIIARIATALLFYSFFNNFTILGNKEKTLTIAT